MKSILLLLLIAIPAVPLYSPPAKVVNKFYLEKQWYEIERVDGEVVYIKGIKLLTTFTEIRQLLEMEADWKNIRPIE